MSSEAKLPQFHMLLALFHVEGIPLNALPVGVVVKLLCQTVWVDETIGDLPDPLCYAQVVSALDLVVVEGVAKGTIEAIICNGASMGVNLFLCLLQLRAHVVYGIFGVCGCLLLYGPQGLNMFLGLCLRVFLSIF